MRRLYYDIEYGRLRYEPSLLGDQRQEKELYDGNDKAEVVSVEERLDKLLALFDTLAKLRAMNVIRPSDLDLLECELLQVYTSEEIQRYLEHLDEWFFDGGMRIRPFQHFRKVCKELRRDVQFRFAG